MFKNALNKENLEVTADAMKNTETPAILFLSEESRRIREMYEHHKMSGMEGELDIDKLFPEKYKLVLNTNNELVAKLAEKADDKELSDMLAQQIYDMALMNMRRLTPDEMSAFSRRTMEIMQKML